MSQLNIYRDESGNGAPEKITDPEQIARALAPAGIRFEQWEATAALTAESTPDQILAAYRGAVDQLMRERGFVSTDVINVTAGATNVQELRAKFLKEHVHSDDEARFFVDGSGLFCIHHESTVYAVLCERGDLINVPAGTRHWFDFGADPNFKCIRFFGTPDGWVAQFTGSDISGRFPKHPG